MILILILILKNFLKNFDIDIDFENQILENIDIDIERKFDIVPCLIVVWLELEGKSSAHLLHHKNTQLLLFLVTLSSNL